MKSGTHKKVSRTQGCKWHRVLCYVHVLLLWNVENSGVNEITTSTDCLLKDI